jgi:hypothetical protein
MQGWKSRTERRLGGAVGAPPAGPVETCAGPCCQAGSLLLPAGGASSTNPVLPFLPYLPA